MPAAVAVIGQADEPALAAVWGEELPPDWWVVLTRHSAVCGPDGRFSLPPALVQELLTNLESTDLPCYRLWHERAIRHLAERLRTGESIYEDGFMAALDRLINRLVSDEPTRLYPFLKTIQETPLAAVPHQQSWRYFNGLALGLADHYPEALVVLDALLAESRLEAEVNGRVLNARAVFCRYLGRLEEARAGYHASLVLWQKMGNSLRQGIARLNLGIVAYQLQAYDEAEAQLSQAMSLFAGVGSRPWHTAAQNELGLVQRDQGRWAEALACFEAVAAQRQTEGAMEMVGRALLNQGEVLLFQGQLEAATAVLRQALTAMQSQVYGVDVYLALGLVHQAKGAFPEAETAFRQALALAAEIGRREMLAEVHYRLGEVLRRAGQAEAALVELVAAAEMIESTRQPVRDEGLKISLLGRWQQVYEGVVLHCLTMKRPLEAFAWAERARARAFADAVGGSKPYSVSRDQWAVEENTAVFSYFTTGVLADTPLLRAIATQSPVREHLLTPAKTWLFVLTHEGLTVHECPLNPNSLVSHSPRGDDRSRFWKTAVLRQLHTLIFPEEMGHELAQINTNYRLWYIVPHGPIHRVPFAALEDAAGRPFVQSGKPAIRYAPSVALLKRPLLARERPFGMLAVGYDGQGLRHTEKEAAYIAQLTGGRAWLGREGKKEALQQVVGQVGWLHFACHGRFDEENPLHSYLETAEGELLTAQEVLESWQLQAELVVLSACQSGVSRILRGDEPMGFIRAFLAAGARAVLVSQWSVADLPTFLLMRHFYQGVQAGHDVTAALQAAQGWLRDLTVGDIQVLQQELPALEKGEMGREEERPFAHPRFWAAFILVGT